MDLCEFRIPMALEVAYRRDLEIEVMKLGIVAVVGSRRPMPPKLAGMWRNVWAWYGRNGSCVIDAM